MAQARPDPAGTDHPVLEQLRRRDPWEPRRFTRTLARVSAGTRAVAAQVNPLERQWHAIADRALHGPHPIWVVLGDSIAQGVGASSLARSWVARIAGALHLAGRPHGVVNLSRSGARGRDVRDHQLPLLELLDTAPALVTCGVGSNDLMRNPHPPSVSARVNEVVDLLPPGSVVSTLPAPPVSPSGRWVNRSIRRTAQRRGMTVADVVPHLRGPRGAWAPDRFHPNDHGYGAWVEAHCSALGLDPDRVPDAWPLDID